MCKFHKWSFKYWFFLLLSYIGRVYLNIIMVFISSFFGGEDFSFQLQILSKWEALSFQYSFIRKKRITFLLFLAVVNCWHFKISIAWNSRITFLNIARFVNLILVFSSSFIGGMDLVFNSKSYQNERY